MKFQEIDFHIELFKAYLEPPGARINYLDMLRKESKFKRETFFIKLESAFNNIQTAYQNEVNKKRSFIQGMEKNFNLSIPIQFFGRYPVLSNFSREFGFDHHINRETLEGLSYLLNSLRVIYLIKEKKKAISKKLEDLPKNQNETPNNETTKNPFESIWLSSPQVSIDSFLEKGYDLGLWDENNNLMAKRGTVYGSGKALLANIYISLKTHSINENIDHKKVGEVFCNFFKVQIDPIKVNSFKQFQKGANKKQIEELKKRFK